MKKTCKDTYGYGCTNTVDSDDQEVIESMFRSVPSDGGGRCYRGVCRECERRMFREKYKCGEYFNKKTKDVGYDEPFEFGNTTRSAKNGC